MHELGAAANLISFGGDLVDKRFERLCVFCGGELYDSNKEHVIPRWLLQTTGDPKRVVPLGFGRQEKPDILSLPFDSFVAPAHRQCNERYSSLESGAKQVVDRVLSGASIAAREVPVLLDWLDKVRVSVCLLHRMNSNNIAGITPQFHVDQRIGLTDRLVAVYVFPNHADGLGAAGTSTPVFSAMPSVFALRINSLLFVSVATHAVCSKPMGLPWIAEKSLHSTVRDPMPPVSRWNNDDSLSLLPTPSMLVGQAISPLDSPGRELKTGKDEVKVTQSEPIDFLSDSPRFLEDKDRVDRRTPEEPYTLGHVVRAVLVLQLALWETRRGPDDNQEFTALIERNHEAFLRNWDRHHPHTREPLGR